MFLNRQATLDTAANTRDRLERGARLMTGPIAFVQQPTRAACWLGVCDVLCSLGFCSRIAGHASGGLSGAPGSILRHYTPAGCSLLGQDSGSAGCGVLHNYHVTQRSAARVPVWYAPSLPITAPLYACCHEPCRAPPLRRSCFANASWSSELMYECILSADADLKALYANPVLQRGACTCSWAASWMVRLTPHLCPRCLSPAVTLLL